MLASLPLQRAAAPAESVPRLPSSLLETRRVLGHFTTGGAEGVMINGPEDEGPADATWEAAGTVLLGSYNRCILISVLHGGWRMNCVVRVDGSLAAGHGPGNWLFAVNLIVAH